MKDKRVKLAKVFKGKPYDEKQLKGACDVTKHIEPKTLKDICDEYTRLERQRN